MINLAIKCLKKELQRVEKSINYRQNRDIISNKGKVIPIGDMYTKQTVLQQTIKLLEAIK